MTDPRSTPSIPVAPEATAFYCEASIWRGEWSSLRSEPCGKPGKGHKEDGHGHPVGLCGIHLRAKNVMHFQDRHIAEGAGKGWVR